MKNYQTRVVFIFALQVQGFYYFCLLLVALTSGPGLIPDGAIHGHVRLIFSTLSSSYFRELAGSLVEHASKLGWR